PEPFVLRRVGEHRRAREQVRARAVVDETGAYDAVAVTGARHRIGERGRAPAVLPRDDQTQLTVVGGELVERAHERGEVLAGLDGADGEDVPVATGARPTRGSVTGGNGVDAIRHDVHTRRIDVEGGHDL